jgi:two-component system CheB/CheR fusion protein
LLSFSVEEQEVRGQRLLDVGNGRWNDPALERLLQELLPHSRDFHDFPTTQLQADGKVRRLLLDGRRIQSTKQGAGVILLVVRDARDTEAS